MRKPIPSVACGLLLVCFPVMASFENLKLRHLSPVDIVQVMNMRFPLPDLDPTNPDSEELEKCQKISSSNAFILGASSPLSGKPVQSEPHTVFVKWFFDCLNLLATEHFKHFSEKSDLTAVAKFIPEEILAKISSFEILKSSSWNELNLEDREKIIRFQLEMAIGPEKVLADVKSIDSFSAKTARILGAADSRERKSLLETVKWIAVATMMQPEGLRY